MKRRFILFVALGLGTAIQTQAQTGGVLLTTNQVKTASEVNIGVIYVPTNYLAFIRGDFAMSGSTNYAVSTQSIAVQNSNGVLYVSAPTATAYFSSSAAASWGMGYAISGSTNVLCQGRGVAAESWNGQWQGSVELIPMATEQQGGPPPPPPLISGIGVSSTNSTDAMIVWSTDQAANSTVEWGTTTAYGNTASAATLVTAHSLGISNMTASTIYHYRVSSTNATGQSAASTDNTFVTAPMATSPPLISGISVSLPDSTDATIVWTTDQSANSTVEWGTTTPYGTTASTPASVTSHSVSIGGLTPSTTYHYRVSSTNANGQSATSADNSFVTLGDGLGNGCPLTNGLAGYWPFNGDYNDYSGLGNNLTPYNSIRFAPGYIFQALDDTVGDSAYCLDNATLAMGNDSSFTVSCWVNLENSSIKSIVQKGDIRHPNNATFFLYNTGSAFRFGMGNGSTWAYAQASVTPLTYTWYNLVGIYDSAAHQMSLWVNGISNTPTSWTYGTRYFSGPFTVGANADHTLVVDGSVDEVVLWTNRALTSVEVGQIYGDTVLGKTPLNYCATNNARTTAVFVGDARFSRNGSTTNLPDYFATYSWVSNHNARVVNYPGGGTPDVEYINDVTNLFSTVMSYNGPGTNVYFFMEVGINDIILLASNGHTWVSLSQEITNYVNLLASNGVKVIPLTIYDLIGLENDAGDGILPNSEAVRQYVNQAITNCPANFTYLFTDPLIPTNGTWYSANLSELNDAGNTNIAMQLNALLNSKAP